MAFSFMVLAAQTFKVEVYLAKVSAVYLFLNLSTFSFIFNSLMSVSEVLISYGIASSAATSMTSLIIVSLAPVAFATLPMLV